MDHDLPDREEIACALEVVESRLARQGQYDQAVDVFAASRLLRLADDEITRLRAENEALRADVVWAVRGYIRPIDDGQRLAIGIDPQTLFTRMVEWDGTDADILRAVREARLSAANGEGGR